MTLAEPALRIVAISESDRPVPWRRGTSSNEATIAFPHSTARSRSHGTIAFPHSTARSRSLIPRHDRVPSFRGTIAFDLIAERCSFRLARIALKTRVGKRHLRFTLHSMNYSRPARIFLSSRACRGTATSSLIEAVPTSRLRRCARDGRQNHRPYFRESLAGSISNLG